MIDIDRLICDRCGLVSLRRESDCLCEAWRDPILRARMDRVLAKRHLDSVERARGQRGIRRAA